MDSTPTPYALPTPAGGAGFTAVPDLRTALPPLADSFLNLALLIAGILAVAYLIYGGMLYITAGGDPNRAKAARATIINVALGVIALGSVFFIIRLAVAAGLAIGSLPV